MILWKTKSFVAELYFANMAKDADIKVFESKNFLIIINLYRIDQIWFD